MELVMVRIPVGDEDALVRHVRAVVSHRLVRVTTGCRLVGIGRLEVQQIERRADVVLGVQLIVQLAEAKVLIGEPRLNSRPAMKDSIRGRAQCRCGISAGQASGYFTVLVYSTGFTLREPS